jgi:hypothetical protein
VEVKRVAAMAPLCREVDGGPEGLVQIYELGPPPRERVVCVPIVPRTRHAAMFAGSSSDFLRTEAFQAIEYGMQVDGTYVRWWGWQPRSALQPEVRSKLNRARAYAHRVHGFLADLGVRESHGDARSAYWEHTGWGLTELMEWTTTLLEDIEQTLGEP